MPPQLITPPADEPVTLDQAKAHLRLEVTDDDEQVTALIIAARHFVEEHCWRGLMTQTWELIEPRFPDDTCRPLESQGLELPMGNLASVTSVKYIDPDGVEQVVDPADYSVDQVNVPGRLRLAYGKAWPTIRTQWDAVRVRYVVGWDTDTLPGPIAQAILLLVGQLYENRTPEVPGVVAKFDFTVEALLRPYRLVRF